MTMVVVKITTTTGNHIKCVWIITIQYYAGSLVEYKIQTLNIKQ